MLESKFQAELVKDLKKTFEGCYVIKTDPTNNQGIPDLLIFYKDKWAALECKRSATAKHRPNQDYHIGRMNDMSFARFIYPENKKEVLHEMARSFEA